jgi:hypothetical protein
LRWLDVCQVKWLLATVLLHLWKMKMFPLRMHKYWARLILQAPPLHNLALKPGACIILIKNLNTSHGHCNGTRHIIMEMTPRVIKAEKLSANA